MSGQAWPAKLVHSDRLLGEQEAERLVALADDAVGRHRSERTGPTRFVELRERWTSDGSGWWDPDEADPQGSVMLAQWVIEWLDADMSEEARILAGTSIDKLDVRAAIGIVISELATAGRPVPGRIHRALDVLCERVQASEDVRSQLDALDVSDRALSWAHELGIDCVRVRWVGEPRRGEREKALVEFTPRGATAPEWMRTTDHPGGLIDSLLDRDFAHIVRERLTDDRYNPRPAWQSLFPQDAALAPQTSGEL